MWSCGYRGRRYFTKQEQLEWLQEYKEELEAELKGVEEQLKELEK